MGFIYVERNLSTAAEVDKKPGTATNARAVPVASSPLGSLYDVVLFLAALDSYLFIIGPWLFWALRQITDKSDTYDLNYVLISSLVSICLASHLPKMHYRKALDRWSSRVFFMCTQILAFGFLRAYLGSQLNSILMGASFGYIMGINDAETRFALTGQMDQLPANLVASFIRAGLKLLFVSVFTAAFGVAYVWQALQDLNPLDVNLMAMLSSPSARDAPMLAMLAFHALGLLLLLSLPRIWGFTWFGIGLPIRSCLRYGSLSMPDCAQKSTRYDTGISATLGLPADTPFLQQQTFIQSATPRKPVTYLNLSLAVHSMFLALVLSSTMWALTAKSGQAGSTLL